MHKSACKSFRTTRNQTTDHMSVGLYIHTSRAGLGPPHILGSLQVVSVYLNNTISTEDLNEILQEVVSILHVSSVK